MLDPTAAPSPLNFIQPLGFILRSATALLLAVNNGWAFAAFVIIVVVSLYFDGQE